MTKEEFARVQQEARRTNPTDLTRRSDERMRKEKIDKEIQRHFAETGATRCTWCTAPVIIAEDFEARAQLVEGAARKPLVTCRCGKLHVAE